MLLVFFPWAFSSVCGGELAALRDDAASFVNESTQLLAVSIDSKFAQRAFAEREGYAFPLLADSWPHGEVARRYGVFDDGVGAALRGAFVLDQRGVVRWSIVNGIGEARDSAAYRDALAALSVG